MNIIRKFLLLISLCVIFVSCVANISNDNTCTKELSVNDDTHRKEVLIEEGNNYKIVEVKNGDETYYEYTIYDYRNKMLVKESCFRPPIFDEIGESIIKTTISHGVGSYSCAYYDLCQSRISEQFQGVIAEKDNLIAYKVFDNEFKIIIQDMFDKSVYFSECLLPDIKTATFDVVNAYFEENKLIIIPDSKYNVESIVFNVS